MVAQILLIFSVANIALAAPTVPRQRRLDVAKAASQKRWEFKATPPHDGLESPSAAANRLTPLAPGPPIWGDEPHSSSRLNGWLYWLDPESMPEPYPTAANRIATWGSGATGHFLPGLPSAPLPRPPHSSPPDEGVLSSSDRITTQASGEESLGNGVTGHFPPDVPPPRPPQNIPPDEWAWSSSDGITTHTSGAESSGNGATGDLPPESSSAASDGITTPASGATSLSSSDSGHLGDLPPPPHQGSAPGSLAAPEADELFTSGKTVFYNFAS